jgi:hypothetical protein
MLIKARMCDGPEFYIEVSKSCSLENQVLDLSIKP